MNRSASALVGCALTAFGTGAFLSTLLLVVDGGEDYQAVGFVAVRGLMIAATLVLLVGGILLARHSAALRDAPGMATAGASAVGVGLGLAVVAFQVFASAGSLISENATFEYVEPSAVEYVLMLAGALLAAVGMLLLLLSPLSRRRVAQAESLPVRDHN